MTARAPATAGVLTAALAMIAVAAAIAHRPSLIGYESFLFGDQGHNLWIADALVHGRALYTDVFSQYGPLTAWVSAWGARIAGNTPLTYMGVTTVITAAALGVLAAAYARTLSAAWATLAALVVVMPVMLPPISLVGGLAVSPYIALERLAIAVLVFAWRAPHDRTARRAIVLGLVAGGSQWARFGAAVLMVGGLLVADVVSAWTAADRRRAAIGMGWMLVGAAVGEGLLAGWSVVHLPTPMALDVLWPSYFSAAYDWVGPGLRWPSWPSWQEWVAQFAALPMALAAGAWLLARHRRDAAVGRSVLLLAMYGIGIAGLFRHVFHFRQYAWLIVAVLPFALAYLRTTTRAVVLLIAAPVLLVCAKNAVTHNTAVVPVTTARAGVFWLSPADAADVAALDRVTQDAAARGAHVIVGPHASGWYAASGYAADSRHTWFMSAVIRPYDLDAVTTSFRRAESVALCGDGAVVDSLEALHLPDPLAAEVRATFVHHAPISPNCRLFRR